MLYLLSIGSNLGNKTYNLKSAVLNLHFLNNVRLSSVFFSQALLPLNAPEYWNLPFLNMALCGYSQLTPKEMIIRLKLIEEKIGRKLNAEKWSPRIIDIDILLAGNIICDDNELTIPHRDFLKRGFCLLPSVELLPNFIHSVTKNTLYEHLLEFKTNNGIKLQKVRQKLF